MNAEIWTLNEAAKFLRVHPMTLYKLVREGRVPARKVGGAWRFTRQRLETWLDTEAQR